MAALLGASHQFTVGKRCEAAMMTGTQPVRCVLASHDGSIRHQYLSPGSYEQCDQTLRTDREADLRRCIRMAGDGHHKHVALVMTPGDVLIWDGRSSLPPFDYGFPEYPAEMKLGTASAVRVDPTEKTYDPLSRVLSAHRRVILDRRALDASAKLLAEELEAAGISTTQLVELLINAMSEEKA